MTMLTRPPGPPRPERLFTVEEYLRMVEMGILTKHDRVELIEGRIVEKMPTNPAHAGTLQRVHVLLMKACPSEWMARVEAPLQLEKSAPEPDAMIIRAPIERYDHRHPTAQDSLLVIEISDSTLRDDRHEKAKLYAAAKIPWYWIVNLVDRRVEIHSDPTGPDHFPTYRSRQDAEESGAVRLEFPEGGAAEFNVREMLATRSEKNRPQIDIIPGSGGGH